MVRVFGARRELGREAGQAAVETALVMPLFVFILLGSLQLMLMHQARFLTKYAAYKAVRAGSIHNGNIDKMRNAALAVLLPMAGDVGSDRVYNVMDPDRYARGWNALKGNQYSGTRIVEIAVCEKPSNVWWDDPKLMGSDLYTTKLAIQVTFNYKLVIPFANGVLWWMVYGHEHPGLLEVLRTGRVPRASISPRQPSAKVVQLVGMATNQQYVLPIRAGWTMRMFSQYTSNDSDGRCFTPWNGR